MDYRGNAVPPGARSSDEATVVPSVATCAPREPARARVTTPAPPERIRGGWGARPPTMRTTPVMRLHAVLASAAREVVEPPGADRRDARLSRRARGDRAGVPGWES